MRKIIASEVMTVDGYFAGPNAELDWFVAEPEFNEYSIDIVQNAGLMIFGRVTYDLMASYWPSEHARTADPIIAANMNDLPKVVFSRTLESAPWQPAQVLADIDREQILAWKQQSGRNMLILGSGTIVQAFTDLGLIDEYRFIVNPVVLGSGRPLFHDTTRRKLILEKTRQLSHGNVVLYYSPASPTV